MSLKFSFSNRFIEEESLHRYFLFPRHNQCSHVLDLHNFRDHTSSFDGRRYIHSDGELINLFSSYDHCFINSSSDVHSSCSYYYFVETLNDFN